MEGPKFKYGHFTTRIGDWVMNVKLQRGVGRWFIIDEAEAWLLLFRLRRRVATFEVGERSVIWTENHSANFQILVTL